jgi:hypothetical protein
MSVFTLGAWAHIRLIYPPSASASDFLQEPAPCGWTPWLRSSSGSTALQSGVLTTVVWHVAFAHFGGHGVQIVNTSRDANVTVLAELAPAQLLADATTQAANVTIPRGLQCAPGSSCALRVTRTAVEWGRSFSFWSCADITVVDAAIPSDSITPTAVAACNADEDCGPQGQARCVKPKGSPSSAACFCRAGSLVSVSCQLGARNNQPAELEPR